MQAKHILVLGAMLAPCGNALGQIRLGEMEREHRLIPDTVYESYVQTPVPLPVGPMYYLKAWPILERKKARPRDFPIWAKYDETQKYPQDSAKLIRYSCQSYFIYTPRYPHINATKDDWYYLYYKYPAVEISAEEYKALRFVPMKQIDKLLKPYRLPRPRHPDGKLIYGIGELYRYQHPNLYAVEYEPKEQRYYKYRIVLVIYIDTKHPDAARLRFECGFFKLEMQHYRAQKLKPPKAKAKASKS